MDYVAKTSQLICMIVVVLAEADLFSYDGVEKLLI